MSHVRRLFGYWYTCSGRVYNLAVSVDIQVFACAGRIERFNCCGPNVRDLRNTGLFVFALTSGEYFEWVLYCPMVIEFKNTKFA